LILFLLMLASPMGAGAFYTAAVTSGERRGGGTEDGDGTIHVDPDDGDDGDNDRGGAGAALLVGGPGVIAAAVVILVKTEMAAFGRKKRKDEVKEDETKE